MSWPTPTFVIVPGDPWSWIHGSVDGVEVTRANFKLCDDPARRELIQVDMYEPFRHRGYAIALLKELAQAEPSAPLCDSPVAQNTAAGQATVEAARATGVLIHEFGCFRSGAGYSCVIGSG